MLFLTEILSSFLFYIPSIKAQNTEINIENGTANVILKRIIAQEHLFSKNGIETELTKEYPLPNKSMGVYFTSARKFKKPRDNVLILKQGTVIESKDGPKVMSFSFPFKNSILAESCFIEIIDSNMHLRLNINGIPSKESKPIQFKYADIIENIFYVSKKKDRQYTIQVYVANNKPILKVIIRNASIVQLKQK
ncbi:hypothetical protein PAEPH01_0242 [Pancytospora epiphaga]|nr:hypothetical protein PAEPH01_0242 [Pancytospora epiphaga]